MKCGQLSLPHKSPWLRFCAQTFHFPPPSPSSIVWRREASLIVNFWPAVCHKLKMFGRGGSTQTFITRDSELGYMREERDQNIHFLPALLHTLSGRFHLSWHPEDSRKEPYVSASSQQQSQDHHAPLPYHANEPGIQTSGLLAHS